MRSSVFLLVAMHAAIALSQEPNDQPVELANRASTVEEVIKRRDSRVKSANRDAVTDLERIAQNAVANGKIQEAANAWEEVLKLDADHEAATEFFKLVGRPDVPESSDIYRDVLGTWKWFNGAEITFKPRGKKVARRTDGSVAVRGYWKVDRQNKKILVCTPEGKVIDRLVLTRNGQLLQGKNFRDENVWGVRID